MRDKVVIVTGATKGMGFEIAKFLLENGAYVTMVYSSDQDAAKACEDKLKGFKGNYLLLQADITSDSQREKIVSETKKQFNKIDVLVNNAGIAAKEGFLKVTSSEYDRVLDVNLKAPIFLANLVAKVMIEQKSGGSIINFCSISGHRGTSGISYDASKAGLINATRTMAGAVGKYDIRVNSISPGYHKTEMNRYHWSNNTDVHKNSIKNYPLQRAADAKEICGTVLYLATDLSSFTTGTDILVDGGYSTVWPGRN